MLPDIHLGKRAGVSYADHLHSEVPEEINDLQRLSPQTEDKNYRSHHWTQQLLENKHLDTERRERLTLVKQEPTARCPEPRKYAI